MQTFKFQKNGEDWREFKLGKSGGSSFHDLYPSRNITKEIAMAHLDLKGIEYNPKSKAGDILELLTAQDIGEIKAEGDKKDAFYKLVAERIARPITANDYEDKLNGQKFSMMLRGHILEEEGVREFEKRNNIKVDGTKDECVVWQRGDNKDSIVSPDATIGVKEAVEIKAFASHRIIRAFDEQHYPEECHEQIVKYFIVNPELEVLHFVLYTDVMPSLSYLQFDIFRADIEQDIREFKAFEDAILIQANALAERLAF